jgi:integrase/recombinase XerD
MSHPTQVLFTGPLIPFAEGFAQELIKQGYRPHAATHQLRLIAHLSRWLGARGMAVEDITPAMLNKFLMARRLQGYALWRSPQALMPFLDYLRSLGLMMGFPKTQHSPTEELLTRYGKYLLDVRGLAKSSVHEYVKLVRPFVTHQLAGGEFDWVHLTGADLVAFVRNACRSLSLASSKLLVTVLRSFLGYLYLEGLIHRPLTTAVPPVSGSKLASLPRALQADEVAHLLAACRRRTRTGRRDFAILMLLVRLGLRAGEVRTLSVDDVDWRAGELVIRGKGTRLERLPLPADVGRALAAYLRRGRPTTAQGRTIFVRIHAPHRALTGVGVTNVVRMAASRAGLIGVTAHRLRHTVATQMVRSGVPLPEISQVLRHRRLITTAIYAKVDREGLRSLARRWPGGLP